MNCQVFLVHPVLLSITKVGDGIGLSGWWWWWI